MQLLDPGHGLTERLVTLPDGRRLRTVVAGEAEGPLVVFEAGMSAPAASWVHTQREVSAVVRTLSYDRAGYGGSDVDPQPRTLERIVEDLTALLDAVGETGPVVLVGHSWGGPILRLFAATHPARVSGLVLVDATVAESMPERSARLLPHVFALLSLVAAAGGKALVVKATTPHPLSPLISEADKAVLLRDYACAQAMRAGRREAQQILPALPLLRRLQAEGTPSVPTVCVQGGRVDRGMTRLRPILNQTAHELMSAVPDGRCVVVDEAGHLVPQECPGPVRDAVLDVVEAARVVR